MTAPESGARRVHAGDPPAHSGLIDLAALVLLFVPAAVSFGPVFGGFEGYLAAGGGVAIGLALGWLSRRFDWALATVLAAAVGSYLLLGGVFALRKTTLWGFVPTVDTLVRLVPLSVQSWRDLLTVSLPASNFSGPAVVPFLSGLVLALIATRVGLAERRYLWALLPPSLMLLIGVLWGLDEAPWGASLGLGLGVVALAWATWRRVEGRRVQGEQLLESSSALTLTRSRLGRAATLIAVTGAVALLASPLLATADRHVLRQAVEPPLNLHDYASPLTSYRYYELDQRRETLFRVAGLPSDTRLRLATLNFYDGHVYAVEDASAGFVRMGSRTLGTSSGTPVELDVAVEKYSGVWVPGGGEVRGVTFAGPRATAQTESLYYNPYGGTLITTTGLESGDRYTVTVVPHRSATELPANATVASASEPDLTGVPDVIGQTAADFASQAKTPVDQLRALEKRLQEGYYSDGSDGLAPSGHSAARIAAMLTAQELIGDDEQYAVAMALMARQLGLPCRVVLGFYPDPAQPATSELPVTGTMAHVWVEVPFDGLGWVVFDPTPDRNRTAQTIVPQPKPTPRPQVLPPPEPPVNRVDATQDDPGKKRDAEDPDTDNALLRIALAIGLGLGIAALLASPFLLIGLLKRRRRGRRLNDPLPAGRIAGAWAELADTATDLGTRTPATATRREVAAVVALAHPDAGVERIAADVDAGVFGAAEPTPEAGVAVWAAVDGAVATINGQLGPWRRIRGFCSIRSLRGRPGTSRVRGLLRRVLPRKDPR